MPDILQPGDIDARHRVGGKLVRAGPLPDRELDRHAFGIHALGVKRDQRLQPFAGGGAVEAGVSFDRGDAPLAPVLQHGFQQGRAVAEAAVEAALGDAEVFGQNLHPHPLDAGPGDFLQAGLDPALASHLAGPRVCLGSLLDRSWDRSWSGLTRYRYGAVLLARRDLIRYRIRMRKSGSERWRRTRPVAARSIPGNATMSGTSHTYAIGIAGCEKSFYGRAVQLSFPT